MNTSWSHVLCIVTIFNNAEYCSLSIVFEKFNYNVLSVIHCKCCVTHPFIGYCCIAVCRTRRRRLNYTCDSCGFLEDSLENVARPNETGYWVNHLVMHPVQEGQRGGHWVNKIKRQSSMTVVWLQDVLHIDQNPHSSNQWRSWWEDSSQLMTEETMLTLGALSEHGFALPALDW